MSFLGTVFGKGKSGGATDVALDIGSSGIRGVLFSGNGTKINVAKFIRVPFAPKMSQSGSVFAAGEIEQVMRELLAKNPDFSGMTRGSVGLSGDFLRASTFRAEFQREKPKDRIDQSELKNLIEKAERASRDDVLTRFNRNGNNAEGDIRLISSNLEEILIDGYAVADPVGLGGSEVQITLFNLYAEEAHFAFLQKLKQLLGVKHLVPMSLSYGVCRAYSAAAVSEQAVSGIFIDIGEFTTSVSVLAKGAFLGTRAFSLGGDMFTHRIAMHLHLGKKEAEEIKHQYSAGSLSQSVSRKISAVLRREVAIWVSGVEIALEEFSPALELFPSTTVVYGGGSALPDISRLLLDGAQLASIPFLEKRTVLVQDPKELAFMNGQNDIADAEKLSPADVPVLCLACASLLSRTKNSQLNRITERAMKLANA